MSTLKLKGSSSGEAEVTVAAAAGTPTFTLPTTVGSANQLLKNSGTAGTLEYSNNLTFDGSKLTVTGQAEVSSDLDIASDIRHIGDTDTKIRFPAADTVTVQTGGNERLRIDSSGNTTLNTGNLVIGTAGKGIDFSAQTASSATGATTGDELLDHYEEGSWTPAFASNQGQTPTHATQVGQYTRIGNLVTVQFYCSWTACTNMGTQARIGGLPFTSHYYGTGSCFLNNWNFNNDQVRDVVLHHSGHYEIYLYYTRDNDGWEPLPCDDNAAIIGTMTYKVA